MPSIDQVVATNITPAILRTISPSTFQEYPAARQFFNQRGRITGPNNVTNSPEEITGRLGGGLQRRPQDGYWQRPPPYLCVLVHLRCRAHSGSAAA